MRLPLLEQLHTTTTETLRADVFAGLTVAVMLVPQAMAYALLAGLPPVMGLYSAAVPSLVYAFFASSRHLAVGPVAIVSLLSLSGVSVVAEQGTAAFISYSVLLALMVGVIQWLLGLMRAGFVVNFLSHSVISGFTSAAAIIIALSQLRHLLGLRLPPAHGTLDQVSLIARNLPQVSALTLSIGIISMALLWLAKRLSKRFPASLVLVVTVTLLVYTLSLEHQGVAIVGAVPGGLPQLALPTLDLTVMLRLLPTALTIAFIAFVESFAVAQTVASRAKYALNANQELVALGLANIVGSLFGSFTVTGGFSRTALYYQSGGKSQLAAVVAALLVILTLLFLTPLFYYLPNAVLAAIVIMAVIGLVDVRYPRHLFRIKTIDGWTLVVTFLATLLLEVEIGILIGIAFSLLVFVWRSAYPHTAELGYLPEQKIFRNIRRYPQAQTFEHIVILRIDAALYFANMAYLKRYLNTLLTEREGLSTIILEFTPVNDIDAVALEALAALMQDYARQGITVLIAGMKGPVRDLAYKAGWFKTFKQNLTFASVEQALMSCEAVIKPPRSDPFEVGALDDAVLRRQL
jgi:SulP family sulfate permease